MVEPTRGEGKGDIHLMELKVFSSAPDGRVPPGAVVKREYKTELVLTDEQIEEQGKLR